MENVQAGDSTPLWLIQLHASSSVWNDTPGTITGGLFSMLNM